LQPVYFSDPAWKTTLPQIIAPLPDEWLPGLLLRCDSKNHWNSKTTLSILQRLSPKKIDWYNWSKRMMHRYIYIKPYLLDLDQLIQLLAITKDAVLATTYYFERTYLYQTGCVPERLDPPFFFHLCPNCVAESRLLRRTLVLPHITHCPQHQCILLHACQCGSSLRLFHSESLPFTCYTCGTDWADLPKIEASPERLALEYEILCWYEFFFSKGEKSLKSILLYSHFGNKEPLERKVNLLKQKIMPMSYYCNELSLLGDLIVALVECNLFPTDFIDSEDSLGSDLEKTNV
jgi:hypothetical protein